MDELERNNYAELCGTLAAPPALSHEKPAGALFTFPLEIQRLSGTIDRVNVVCASGCWPRCRWRNRQGCALPVMCARSTTAAGRGAKLVITVFARDIAPVTSRMTAT